MRWLGRIFKRSDRVHDAEAFALARALRAGEGRMRSAETIGRENDLLRAIADYSEAREAFRRNVIDPDQPQFTTEELEEVRAWMKLARAYARISLTRLEESHGEDEATDAGA